MNKKIGLVLSGGGIRGIAHLGVMKALREMGVEISAYSGCSAGSIAGVMAAAGYSPEEVLDIVLTGHVLRYLRPSLNGRGLMKMDKLHSLFLKYLPHNSFEELQKPLTVTAVDILAGEIIYYNKGELITPILASCSIPGVFEPIQFKGKTLVDGGVLNNFPTEPLRDSCDVLIGSHCNHAGAKEKTGSIRNIIVRSLYLSINHITAQKVQSVEILIEPPYLRDYNALNPSKIREIFTIGYRHTLNMRAEIEKIS